MISFGHLISASRPISFRKSTIAIETNAFIKKNPVALSF
tara:strand:- start:47 stop:163 length:117 start_codon:yes stop_codon:yes gene_type:complete